MYFRTCFNLFFLPYKIIFSEILFDNVDWIDTSDVSGWSPRVGKITVHAVRFYLKNSKIKELSFIGNTNRLDTILNNWRNIAKYKNK
jgi:hypothetical protein